MLTDPDAVLEKPAILRLKIKVYLGGLGFSQSMVWDEPMVVADGEEIHPKPDLIAIKGDKLWWIEIKDHKDTVSKTDIAKLIEAIKKVKTSKSSVFIRKDGKEKVDDVKIDEVLIISGKGGFSATVNRLGMENKFKLMEPEDLKIVIVTLPMISNDKLLGIEIQILPIGTEVTIQPPKKIKTPEAPDS